MFFLDYDGDGKPRFVLGQRGKRRNQPLAAQRGPMAVSLERDRSGLGSR